MIKAYESIIKLDGRDLHFQIGKFFQTKYNRLKHNMRSRDLGDGNAWCRTAIPLEDVNTDMIVDTEEVEYEIGVPYLVVARIDAKQRKGCIPETDVDAYLKRLLEQCGDSVEIVQRVYHGPVKDYCRSQGRGMHFNVVDFAARIIPQTDLQLSRLLGFEPDFSFGKNRFKGFGLTILETENG